MPNETRAAAALGRRTVGTGSSGGRVPLRYRFIWSQQGRRGKGKCLDLERRHRGRYGKSERRKAVRRAHPEGSMTVGVCP
jgi:hypothetical protein